MSTSGPSIKAWSLLPVRNRGSWYDFDSKPKSWKHFSPGTFSPGPSQTHLRSRKYQVISGGALNSLRPPNPISANLSAASFRRKRYENRKKPLVRHSGAGRNPVKRACDTNPPNWDSHSQLAAFSTFASTLSIASPAEWRTPCSHAVRTKPGCEHHSIL